MSQPGGQSAKVTLIISVLGILTATMTVVTGVLAYQTAAITKEKEQAQSSAASSDNSVSDLQRQNDALMTEINELRSQSNVPGPAGDPLPLPGPTVRHSGQLVLAAGVAADLDAPQSNPQWGPGDSASNDIAYDESYQGISHYTGIPTLALGTTKADYNSCRNTTGYASEGISPDSVQPGMYACIKTSENRYSALRIVQVSPQKLTLNVVTYDPPFDSY